MCTQGRVLQERYWADSCSLWRKEKPEADELEGPKRYF